MIISKINLLYNDFLTLNGFFCMSKNLYRTLMSFFLLLGILSLIISGSFSYVQYVRLSKTYNNLIESYQTIRAANQSIISLDEAALDVHTFLETKNPDVLA